MGKKRTFKAAVLSNSAFSANGNPEKVQDCGHQHRTILNAQLCLWKHYANTPQATVIDQDGNMRDAIGPYEFIVRISC